MAKPVTLAELAQWIEKNEARTWHWPGPTHFKERTLEIKYIRFNLDTRDMKIFSLSVDGAGEDRMCYESMDDKDWTILEALEAKLVPIEAS